MLKLNETSALSHGSSINQSRVNTIYYLHSSIRVTKLDLLISNCMTVESFSVKALLSDLFGAVIENSPTTSHELVPTRMKVTQLKITIFFF
jgi:hypothetical protein